MSPPAIPGLGVDLVEIERLERALERYPRLAERLFTDGERAYAAGRRRPGRHLAVRFAAKEAVVKALAQRLPPLETEVLGGGSQAPLLHLRGTTRELAAAAGLDLSVSLSHTGDHAMAVVCAVPPAR